MENLKGIENLANDSVVKAESEAKSKMMLASSSYVPDTRDLPVIDTSGYQIVKRRYFKHYRDTERN